MLAQIKITTAPGAARRLVRMVIAAVDELNYPEPQRYDLQLVLAEWVQNIVRHAYSGRVGGPILLTVRYDQGLLLDFEDHGPVRLSGLPSGASLDDNREPGGRGIPLIRSLVEEFRYRPTDKGAVTHIKFAKPKEA